MPKNLTGLLVLCFLVFSSLGVISIYAFYNSYAVYAPAIRHYNLLGVRFDENDSHHLYVTISLWGMKCSDFLRIALCKSGNSSDVIVMVNNPKFTSNLTENGELYTTILPIDSSALNQLGLNESGLPKNSYMPVEMHLYFYTVNQENSQVYFFFQNRTFPAPDLPTEDSLPLPTQSNPFYSTADTKQTLTLSQLLIIT
jgi:hypothetical protein